MLILVIGHGIRYFHDLFKFQKIRRDYHRLFAANDLKYDWTTLLVLICKEKYFYLTIKSDGGGGGGITLKWLLLMLSPLNV